MDDILLHVEDKSHAPNGFDGFVDGPSHFVSQSAEVDIYRSGVIFEMSAPNALDDFFARAYSVSVGLWGEEIEDVGLRLGEMDFLALFAHDASHSVDFYEFVYLGVQVSG